MSRSEVKERINMYNKAIKKVMSILKINQRVKWLLIMLIASIFIFYIAYRMQLFSQEQSGTWEVKNELEEIEAYSDIQKEICSLCNDNILDIYQEADGLGIIHLSEWAVIDLEIGLNSTNEQRYTKVSTNIIGKSTFRMITTPARRLCEIEVGLNMINQINTDKMAEFLCKECIGKILDDNIYEFALINFQTKEIKPLEDRVKSFFVDDYHIYCDWGEDEVKIIAVYAPFRLD